MAVDERSIFTATQLIAKQEKSPRGNGAFTYALQGHFSPIKKNDII